MLANFSVGRKNRFKDLMIRIKRLVFRVLLFVLLSSTGTIAQSTYSTYSILGIGDIVDPAVPAAMGMGGLGISNGSYWYLNNTNPALIYFNRIALFSAGVLAETKNISQRGFEPYSAGSGNLSHIAMAFPLKKNRWSFSMGLQPYSTVNYAFFYNSTPTNSPDNTLILNEGRGGFTSINLTVGGLVYKGLSLGIKFNYLFSGFEKTYTSTAIAANPSYKAVYLRRQSVSDLIIGGGLSYQLDLGDYHLGVGLIYDLNADVNGKEFIRVEQRTTATNRLIFADTLNDNQPNSINIPANLGIGVSFGKPRKWMIGLDYKTQDWSNLDVPSSASPDRFGRGNKFVLGGEYVVDALDVKKYINRITFRAGITYEEKPYWLANTQIKEFGINFGWTLPVSQFSSLDFGFVIGNRGTTDNNLVREDFFKVYFGATFNDNRWFIRPKFN